MTKPSTNYLKPSISRQLCSDVGHFETHQGLMPKLIIIDTVDEYATIHDLPLNYKAEDVQLCFRDRLRFDLAKGIKNDEIVADPETTIGAAIPLLVQSNDWSYLTNIKVPTKTHVALAENAIKKIRSKLRAVASQFLCTHGMKLPLCFVSQMLHNIVRKMNYVSNQGTHSIASPAVLRGEEPLDFHALTKVKIGDIVLAYNTTDQTRSNAAFTVVLDHEFSRKPAVTAGFNMETEQNQSAGKIIAARYERVNPKDVPDHIKKKLEQLEFKGRVERNNALKKMKRNKESLIRQISTCDDDTRMKVLKQNLNQIPKELDDVQIPPTHQQPLQPTNIQGGEGNITVNVGATVPTIPTIQTSEPAQQPQPMEPTLNQPSTSTSSSTIQPRVAITDKKSTAQIQPAEEKRYNLRTRDKTKLQNHLLYHELNDRNAQSRDWNLYIMTNIMHKKGKQLNDFMTFHTSITEALKEDEPKVKDSVTKEWTQVLEAKTGDKSVLKCMNPNFNTRGKTIIPSMMFMKKKMNKVTKKLEKWKARLAAGGHMQNEELYPKKDITVPTLDHSALLTFLSSMMKRKGVRFHSMDFPGAYLSADLDTEIYMIINKQNTDILLESKPELKPFVRDNGTILTKIQKALYGLKESGKLFRDKLVSLFDQFGLKELNSNKCIFKKELPNGKTFYVCVYVDDVIIATDDEETRLAFLEHCKISFPEISMCSEEAFSFLGMAIQFNYKKKTIKYDNSLYIQELVDNHDIKDESIMPYNTSFMNSDDRDTLMDNVRKYKSLVMALFYVAKRTRPDILFAVSYLATKCAEPTEELFEKAKKVLAYLYATKTLPLTHNCTTNKSQPDKRNLLFAFVDASYALHNDMKGHTGALIFDECGNLLFASSTKQKLMGKSSTDAEIIAVHSVMNTIETIKDLFDELNHTHNGSSDPNLPPVCLYQDNQSAIFLMENGDSSSDKSKHMKVRYFYIKSKVDESIINIKYKDTDRMWADLLTKVISNKVKFANMRSIIMNCQPNDKYYCV